VIKLTKKQIARVFKGKKRIFLFLDYDGTLSPIVREPKAAKISSSTKNTLRKLSTKEGFLVGIISGRSLADVKTRVGLKNILYAGNHGLEIYCPKNKQLFGLVLDNNYRLELKKAKAKLKTGLKPIKGVILEDKGPILAVHYRKVKPKEQRKVVTIFNKTLNSDLDKTLFKVGCGKKVLELRPKISFGKADVVRFFHKKFKKTKFDLTLFFGDDLTDEDVFKILKKPDLGIRIGKSKDSKADLYLENPRKLLGLLSYISQAKI